MAQFIKVASTADLAPGEAKCVEAAGKKIALFNLEGSFYAIDDTCTHRGGPLDRKSTRLNSSHEWISYAVFCLKKKRTKRRVQHQIPATCRCRHAERL